MENMLLNNQKQESLYCARTECKGIMGTKIRERLISI
jgi:hypothetical protein